MTAAPPSDPTTDFLAEVGELRLRTQGRDQLLLRLGVVMMVAGIVLGIVAWFLARNTDLALNQRDAIILSVTGVSVSLVGAALWLRYSFAAFLRFWMARLLVGSDHRSPDQGAPR